MMRKRKREEVPEDKNVEEDPAPSSRTHEVIEEGRNEKLNGNGSPTRLPDGFATMVRDNGSRQAVIFAVSCHGHDFRLDRMARVKRFVDEHSSYRPEWRALGKKAGESDEQHLQRLKQIFVFSAAHSVGTVAPLEGSPATKKRKKSDKAATISHRKVVQRVQFPTHERASEQKAAEKVKTPAKDPASKKPKTPAKDPASRKGKSQADESERRKNCAKRLCLPTMQPDQGMEAVSVKNDIVKDHLSDPALQQPAVLEKPSAQSDPAHAPQHLTRQQWESEQDMGELGQHLHEAHSAFTQSSDTFHTFLEIDTGTAIAAEALVGRQVRVLWPEDAAWFLGSVGSYNTEDGKHEVRYEDGDIENILMAASRVRLEISAGEVLLPPPDSEISATVKHLLREANQKSVKKEEAQEMRRRAEELRLLAEQIAVKARSQADVQEPASVTGYAPEAAFALGEVVWAHEKGWPAWPALVITWESARDLSSLRPCKGGVTVWFFGTYEMGCIKRSEVMGFEAGLKQELHTKCKRSVKTFRRALHEVYIYLQSGKLPDQMILDNNDDSWIDYGDESPDGDLSGADFPLQLGKNLTVNSLGRIEFLRQDFHNKKYIWPLGYSAVRTETLPSGKRLACHCQILASPETLTPIFRVTAGAAEAVEADHPAAAWKEVLRRAGAERRTSGLSGPRMFGLDNPAIARLIQSLPNAGRCLSFDAWLGERPPFVPLSPEEEQERLAIEAAAQRLPPGIRAVPAARAVQGVCSVCGEEEETTHNHLLQCDGCREFVHMDCYGVPAPPEGRLWLCDVCKLGPSRAPACALCPVEGGLLKRTTCNRWVHSACTLWVPETAVDMDRGLVDGLQYIPKARFQLSCTVCSQAYGACIQCAGHRACCASFHPLCARAANLCMVAVRDEYDSDSDEEEAAASAQEHDENTVPNCAPSGPQVQKDIKQPVMSLRADCSDAAAGDSGASHIATASGAQQDDLPGSSAASEQTNCLPPETDEGRNAAAGPCRKAQTKLSNGEEANEAEAAAASREGGCAREAKALAPSCGSTAANTGAAAAQPEQAAPRNGAAAKAPARPKRVWREGTALSAGLRLMCYCQKHTALLGPATGKTRMSIVTGLPMRSLHSLNKAAATAHRSAALDDTTAAPSAPADTVADPGRNKTGDAPCSRCMPYNHELRRGHRAPDAIAAALAKRAFVRATPYLVTAAHQPAFPPAPGTRMARIPVPAVRRHSAEQPSELFRRAQVQATQSNAGAASLVGASGAAGPAEPQKGGRPVQSLAERFKEMRRTVMERLTCGKSAIHGWGAFTKVPAAASDMLIEYMGELVRRPVADARERRIYDCLVGAGTYVFGLSDELVVDATRKGNMAHLLNHSCEPNSYSRTITVRCPDTGTLSDHVIIFAKRAIAAGEELTYDYRFSGEEQLPCNCGAPTCRGFVNLPKASADSDTQLVLRSRLKPYVTSGACAVQAG
ncbi:probable histone-lysine N-methyltransferase TRX1 [Coccomyxa sp. Obi]|nr:probable histone-lysine N-methyltransferase TRX1 [Coccomyxa sp. Obi]